MKECLQVWSWRVDFIINVSLLLLHKKYIKRLLFLFVLIIKCILFVPFVMINVMKWILRWNNYLNFLIDYWAYNIHLLFRIDNVLNFFLIACLILEQAILKILKLLGKLLFHFSDLYCVDYSSILRISIHLH